MRVFVEMTERELAAFRAWRRGSGIVLEDLGQDAQATPAHEAAIVAESTREAEIEICRGNIARFESMIRSLGGGDSRIPDLQENIADEEARIDALEAERGGAAGAEGDDVCVQCRGAETICPLCRRCEVECACTLLPGYLIACSCVRARWDSERKMAGAVASAMESDGGGE